MQVYKSFRFLLLSLFSFALVAAAASADPYADLVKTQKAFYAVKSFRGTISNPKMKQPVQLEFVAPDRWHVVVANNNEYIIGNTMSIKAGGMSLKIPMPGSMQGMLQNARAFSANEDIKKDYTIKYLGMTNVGGQNLRTYGYTKNSDPSLTMKMYIASDNLPRRNEVTDKNGTTTVTYSDYNAPIVINP